MPLHGIRLYGLAFGLLASGCGGSSEIAPLPVAAVSLTAGAGLSPGDEIDSLDLVADREAGLHVVWRERLGLYGGTRGGERIVYRHGSGKPLRWGPRVVITDQAYGKARVVAAADGVHVFAGYRLHHWRLPVDGSGVQDLGELLDGAGPGAETFDAIATRDGIAIVFSPGDTRNDPTLYGVTWGAQGSTPPRPVASAPPAGRAGQAMPKLHGFDGRLIVLWTDVAEVSAPVPGTDITAIGDRARVHSAWSASAGVSWTDAGEVAPGLSRSSVTAVAGADTRDGPIAFFASHGVYASPRAGSAWMAPALISGEEWREFPGIADVPALAATECAGQPALAWADARYRRTDRRWWNPLGGFPWSDSPDWANNDLFIVTRGLAGALHDPATLRPQRLSAPGSFTGEIEIAAHDGGLVLLRAGREHVRKGRSDGGAPPEITQLQVPCG